MPRLLLFVVCLTLLAFGVSAKVGLWVGAIAAAVWCGCAVWAVAQLLAPLPGTQRPGQQRRR